MNVQNRVTTQSDGGNEKWRSTKEEWCSKLPKRCSEQWKVEARAKEGEEKVKVKTRV